MVFDISLFSNWIVRLAGVIVILVLSFVIGRVAGRLIERLLHELELNKFLRRKGKRLHLEEVIGISIRYAFYTTGLIIALNYIGVYRTVFQMIGAVLAVLIVIFLLLNIKDFIPNVIAGLFINKNQLVKEIDKDGVNGRIVKVGISGVKVKTRDNNVIQVPYMVLRKLISD